jgi:hypothetical protein
MIVFSFIVGLFSGASLGIILLCLLIAGKKNDAISYIGICPECKRKHAVRDDEVEPIIQKIAQC